MLNPEDPHKPDRDAFKAMLVLKANSLTTAIRARGISVVEEELRSASLAFGIWPDADQSDGFRCLILKGEAVLKVAAGLQGSFQLDMDCTAIPCVDADQAHALCLTYGDGTAHARGHPDGGG